MSQIFHVHPEDPQKRLIDQSVEVIQEGGVVIYPTDAGYAIGCRLNEKNALDRIRQIRQLDQKHLFTMVCSDLSEIATYACVDNVQYRLLKTLTPGAYTFLLTATKEVPKRLLQPKRKTIGIRVPDCTVTLALLEALGEPLLSSTVILPNEAFPLYDPELIYERLSNQVDLVIDGGSCGTEPTSVIDLTGNEPVLVREGKGDISSFL